jgi:hypothetical protein
MSNVTIVKFGFGWQAALPEGGGYHKIIHLSGLNAKTKKDLTGEVF